MEQIKFDLSAATVVDYCGVRVKEKVVITFVNNTEDFTGTYELRFWESRKKVTEIILTSKLVLAPANTLTMTIEPDDDGLIADTHYYEIFDTTVERIIFLGTFTIDE